LGTWHPTGRCRFLLLVVAALLFSSSVFAAPAARVEFTFGDVSALAGDGRIRVLVKGDTVEEGDTVRTNDGRVQLRFTDDGFVSLHTRTVFRIEQYRWGGVNDGSERSFFSLIEGGLRTITGMLAKHNKKAYRMTTKFAVVGIRGTEYTMQLNGGLTGSVAEGEIEVCNAGGCLAVSSGQSYHVIDVNTKPILSNKQTALPPPPPPREMALVPIGAGSGTVGGLVGTTGTLLNTTTDGARTTLDLLNTTATTTSAVLGATQGAVDSLLGGTGLNQPVGGVTQTVDGVVSGTTSALGGTTSGLIDSTGALTGGGVTEMITDTTKSLLAPLKLGF
jgi:hypothetical protein